MKTSTESHAFIRIFGLEEGIRRLCRVGYEALDLSVFQQEVMDRFMQEDWKETCDRLTEILSAHGLRFNQMHTPHPTHMYWGTEEWNERRLLETKRCLEVAGYLQIPYVVVHPGNFKFEPHDGFLQRNLEFYRSLQPYAQAGGFKICVENMWKENRVKNKIIPHICSTATEFAWFMDQLDPRYFAACLDLGHAGLVGEEAADMIRALGKHLQALHVHDNDYLHDTHTLPYQGKMDWESILEALKEIGYRGDITLEAEGFLSHVPKELMEAGAVFMAKTAAYLRDRVRD